MKDDDGIQGKDSYENFVSITSDLTYINIDRTGDADHFRPINRIIHFYQWNSKRNKQLVKHFDSSLTNLRRQPSFSLTQTSSHDESAETRFFSAPSVGLFLLLVATSLELKAYLMLKATCLFDADWWRTVHVSCGSPMTITWLVFHQCDLRTVFYKSVMFSHEKGITEKFHLNLLNLTENLTLRALLIW